MTKTFKSGSTVPSGYYLNLSQWAVAPVSKDGEQLPAGKGEWRPVPTVLALALVPILGATFLMFMPVIGFVLFFQAIIARVGGAFRTSATDLAATVSPGWQPGEAHLTGKSPEGAGTEEKGPIADENLDALEKEIANRRRAS
ncbi:hypothetical protein [Anaeromyxobacter oryzisoli]|jgi:hypothetical protein|uniref:hypothetical protein n=1 Tax=Anaeromyxobacter oryzisoli TaxID=2925408 RepID=UPI001F5AC4F7|nr:hypothetical protein [Anaeromyxobacter sp. SG63]